MDDNQKLMRDVLGIYYDSSEVKMKEVAECIVFKLDGKMLYSDSGGLSYDLTTTCGGRSYQSQTAKPHYSSDVFIEVLNLIEPSFYVNEEVSSAQLETFQFTVKENGKDTMNYSDKHIRIANLLKVLIARDNHAPLAFHLDVEVRRTNSPTHRDAYANRKRSLALQSYGGRYGTQVTSINEFFATICSPDRGTPTYTSYRGNREFKGAIKKIISDKDKRVAIYLIEFLWGNKLSQSTRVADVWDKLALLPYNDCGIKDAVKMRDFIADLKGSYSIKDLHKVLTTGSAQLKPKTELKRWQKILNPVIVNVDLNTKPNGGTHV